MMVDRKKTNHGIIIPYSDKGRCTSMGFIGNLVGAGQGVGSHGGCGGHIAIFLGAFNVPSSQPFMSASVLLLTLSLTVSVPIFLLPSCLDPPSLLQPSSISYCPCEPCPRSSHGTAIEHDEPCPFPSLLSSMHLLLSLLSFICGDYTPTPRWWLIWHLREYSRSLRHRKLISMAFSLDVDTG